MRKLLEIICGKVNKFRGFLIEVAVAVFCHVNVTGLSQGAKGERSQSGSRKLDHGKLSR